MDSVTLQAQIDAIKSNLTAINAAILALTITGVFQYTLDTGQSRQTVTKQDLPRMIKARQSLTNELCTLQARQSGGGTVHVVPRS